MATVITQKNATKNKTSKTGSSKKSVAIIGSGISGLSAAFLLRHKYDVTLYEKAHYFGGHSNTIDIQIDGKIVPVDTGFIVFNHKTYPHLTNLFSHLGIQTQKSDMSFGVSIDSGKIEYSGSSLGQFFAQRKQLFNPKYIKFGLDILTFNAKALKASENQLKDLSLNQFVASHNLGEAFRNWYLYPMASAIWSTPHHKIGEYPALSFIQFFRNHGLLSVQDHPQWYTVTKGSREYVKAIIALPEINAFHSTDIKTIIRDQKGCTLHMEKGEQRHHDICIFATPAHKTLALLDKPTQDEQECLNAFQYSHNKAYLHKDETVMPVNKRAWASWIYKNESVGIVNVTYWMNQLQNLRITDNIFVTLNPKTPPEDDLTFRTIAYDHPIFDQKAIDAQSKIPSLQGQQNTWFCGSYQRYGFHEDGIWSAVRVAKDLGVEPPW